MTMYTKTFNITYSRIDKSINKYITESLIV